MTKAWLQSLTILFCIGYSCLAWSDCFERCQENFEYCLENEGINEQCDWSLDNCQQSCPHDSSTEMVIDKPHQQNHS